MGSGAQERRRRSRARPSLTRDRRGRILGGVTFAERLSGVDCIDVVLALGVRRRTVERWRSGQRRPSLALVPALAAHLGISASTLLREIYPEAYVGS